MHLKILSLILICTFLFRAYDVAADVQIPACFSKAKALKTVIVSSTSKGWQFQIIPKGGLDNQTEYYSDHNVHPEETIVFKGGQSQDYIQIISIEDDAVKVRHYGFARGLGNYDRVKDVPLSEKCITNEGSGGKAAKSIENY